MLFYGVCKLEWVWIICAILCSNVIYINSALSIICFTCSNVLSYTNVITHFWCVFMLCFLSQIKNVVLWWRVFYFYFFACWVFDKMSQSRIASFGSATGSVSAVRVKHQIKYYWGCKIPMKIKCSSTIVNPN